ncbi:MAG: serine/threonine-protein kinase [Bryobacteraceae bacterium]
MANLTQFGKYRILRKLSRSLTDVYLAFDADANREIVLKLVEYSRDDFTPVVIAAERSGAAIQKQLHPHDPRILEIFESGDLNDCFFVAMEYFPGKTLTEILHQEQRIEPKRAARYMAEVCSQLRTLHSFISDVDGRKTAIIHGDIKPSNIQIGMADDPRLLDFGIAKAITTTHNLTHHNLGSPSYCSPERLSQSQVDATSDLWAVGVTLYELVAGMPPYQAQDTRKLESLIQECRPLRALPDSCPDPLKAIIAKSLAPDRQRRYASARQMEDDLRAFLAGRRVAAAAEKQDFWDANATIRKTRTQAVAARNWTVASTVASPKAGRPTAASVRVSSTTIASPRVEALRVENPAQPRRTIFGKLFLTLRNILLNTFRNIGSVWRPALPSSHTRHSTPLALVIASLAGLGVGLIFFMPFAYSYDFAQQSNPLRGNKDYADGTADGVMSDWNLYRQLAAGNSFVSRLPGRLAEESALGASFYRNLMASADKIITGFRSSLDRNLSAVDWERAKLCLRLAAAIDPSGTETRGKLALCNGYEELAANPRPPGAEKSIRDFRLAESLLPHSPDPHLALARVYIYSYRNLAPALAELHEAEQLGYRFGPQETKQEADGYLIRARWELYRAGHAAPWSARLAWLARASSDIQRAGELYRPISKYPDVSASLRRLDQYREQLRAEAEPPPDLLRRTHHRQHLSSAARTGSSSWP